MRLFIALEIPEDVKHVLKDAQKKLKLEGRMTKTKDFHLTLKFLGEVDEEKLDGLKQALSRIEFEPFDASLSATGVFPNRNSIRVVWVGLEPHEKIVQLQQQVESATQRLGFQMDDRFHPHLTLARIKFINNKKEFLESLDRIKVEPKVFRADSFKLIKSTLTPSGPVYEVLSSFDGKS